jgi:hypothetical protein
MDHVSSFDENVVVRLVVITVGEASAPVVQRNDPPWGSSILRENQCQLMEIARVARQAGEADDRKSRLGCIRTRMIVPEVETQAVSGDDRPVRKCLPVRLVHVTPLTATEGM